MPSRLLIPGRVRGALAGMALIAGTRAAGYAIPGRDIQDPLVLASVDGLLLPVWVALWGVAAVACLWDMRRPTLTGYGFRLWLAMMAVWSLAYIWGQVVAALGGAWPLWWQTAGLYGGIVVIVGALTAPLRHPSDDRAGGGARGRVD